jgi:hypothetical protein
MARQIAIVHVCDRCLADVADTSGGSALKGEPDQAVQITSSSTVHPTPDFKDLTIVERDLLQLPVGSRVVLFANTAQPRQCRALPISGEIQLLPDDSARFDPRSPLAKLVSLTATDLREEIRYACYDRGAFPELGGVKSGSVCDGAPEALTRSGG